MGMPSHPFDEFCFIDDKLRPGARVGSAEVIGGFPAFLQRPGEQTLVVIAVGFPTVRYRLAEKLRAAGLNLGSVVDASVIRRPTCELQPGVVVGPSCFLSCDVCIGENAVVNTDTVIGHDSVIGAHSVLARCSVGGGVVMGEGVEVGAGATFFPEVRVGAWSKIAMGASVFQDVPPNVTVAGNPARVISKREPGWHLQ